MKPLKPENPSMQDYFQLSRELNANGLKPSRYRNLMWYWTIYEEIEKLGTFDENLIEMKQM